MFAKYARSLSNGLDVKKADIIQHYIKSLKVILGCICKLILNKTNHIKFILLQVSVLH